MVEKGLRSVDTLAGSGVLPGCKFFSDLLPDDLRKREAYFERFFEFADGADLVFFDPDNGLGITAVQRGRRNSSKYVYPCEIEEAWSHGHSVLFYQHFPRRPRDAFLQRLVGSLGGLPGLQSVYFFVTSHVVFVLLPTGAHESQLVGAIGTFARNWADVVRVEVQHPIGISKLPVPTEPGIATIRGEGVPAGPDVRVRGPTRSSRAAKPAG